MRFEYEDEVASEHPALAGHFPGNPVVPASLLLSRVLSAAQKARGQNLRITAVPVAKFHAVLRPGEKFLIRLESAGTGTLNFRLLRGATLIASGSLRHEITGEQA